MYLFQTRPLRAEEKCMEAIESDYFIIEVANNHLLTFKTETTHFTTGVRTTKWLLEGQYKPQVESLGNIYNVGLADLFLATQTEKA